jgi:hypothetical protein
VRRRNLLGESRVFIVGAFFSHRLPLQRSAAPMSKQLAVVTRMIVTIRKAYTSIDDKLYRIIACQWQGRFRQRAAA